MLEEMAGGSTSCPILDNKSTAKEYDAFGNIVEENGGGSWYDNPVRYAGYQYDGETGL